MIFFLILRVVLGGSVVCIWFLLLRFPSFIRYDISFLCFCVWVFGLFLYLSYFEITLDFVFVFSQFHTLVFGAWFSTFDHVCILVLCFQYLFVFCSLFVVYFYCVLKMFYLFIFTSSRLSFYSSRFWFS